MLSDSEFLSWSIEGELDNILCPLLAIQGLDDEYGSLEQIHGAKRRVEHVELLELAACGHSAHKDQGKVVISEVCRFVRQVKQLNSTYSAT